MKYHINDVDNVYYNCVINNNTNEPVTCKFQETRNDSILNDNTENYYLTIARLFIPVNSIPILIFEPNYYSVTLKYNNDYFRTYLTFIPGSSVQNDFGVYSYKQMVEMINNAFLIAFTNLKIAHPLAPPTTEPFMIFDGQDKPLYISVEDTYDPLVTAPAPTIEIYMNRNLYNLFQNFYTYRNSFNDVNGADYQIIVKDFGNNVTGTEYKIYQDYTSFYLWWQYESVVLRTDRLPVYQENISFNNFNNSNNGVAIYQSILTDFYPSQFGENNTTKSPIIYIPEPQYRLIDLVHSDELRNIDFSFFWRKRGDNALIPIYLFPGSTCSIKFLFIKKNSPSIK